MGCRRYHTGKSKLTVYAQKHLHHRNLVLNISHQLSTGITMWKKSNTTRISKTAEGLATFSQQNKFEEYTMTYDSLLPIQQNIKYFFFLNRIAYCCLVHNSLLTKQKNTRLTLTAIYPYNKVRFFLHYF